ncbi:MAG TPA: GTP cyclohydrolase II [Geminicoccaceae bacterium]|nr:GTP cyclohydrolase II [Geminicoccaceae bacterium]
MTIRIAAVEGITAPVAAAWLDRATEGAPLHLVVTGIRAQALGLGAHSGACVALTLPVGTPLDRLAALACLAGMQAGRGDAARLAAGPASLVERAGVQLARRAGLLPAVLALPDRQAPGRADMALAAAPLLAPPELALERVVETRLPIAATERARLILFRGDPVEREPLALLIGEPNAKDVPLVRLHSECLTGDLFGSLRCDCGEQLDGAIGRMAEAGSGVLLYLRQEGRGIGLSNKLRAYRLQDQGLDTLDANTHLGFAPDERDFAIAAAMLKQLGLVRVRLLTNNPDKLSALVAQGIEVLERVPLSFAANRYNRRYLATKATRSGHMLQTLLGEAPAGGRARIAAGEPPWA